MTEPRRARQALAIDDTAIQSLGRRCEVKVRFDFTVKTYLQDARTLS